MNERDAFVRGIAANLYDDAPRLAFADYLDEHGEHERAEFIRVQCELEPIRDRYEIPRAAELHAREDAFQSKKDWLGDMPKGWDDWRVGAKIEFRRGFPDLLRCSAKAFLEYGPAIRQAHPTVRRIVIHCLNGWGERLAACEALNGLAELELTCWYADADMHALAASPHLRDLQVLVLWLGRQADVGTDSDLCRFAARGKAWSNLRELVLLDTEGNNEKDVRKLATAANRAAKRKVARYERGYPELFPLAPPESYCGCPGRLPDGRAALAAVTSDHDEAGGLEYVVLTFDSTGQQEESFLRAPLPEDVRQLWLAQRDIPFERHAHNLKEAVGFEPAFIRVRDVRNWDGPHRGHWDNWGRRGLPDDPERPTDRNGEHDPNGIGGMMYWLVHEGQYVIGYNAWADKTGRVHST